MMNNPNDPRCVHCTAAFDLKQPTWCGCDHSSRTLQCLRCGQCFCNASALYKRRFWSTVPANVRENPKRFLVDPSAGAAPVATPSPAQKPLVLIADDDEWNRSIIACNIERWGYRAITAASGMEALELVRKQAVDIVVTDALMPAMDGRELCTRLKQMTLPTTPRVVLMTSLYTKRHQREEAFQTFGVDDFLVKPIDFGALQSALRRHSEPTNPNGEQ